MKSAYASVVILLIAISLFGCLGMEQSVQDRSISKVMSESGQTAPMPQNNMMSASSASPQQKTVIKTANAQVEVKEGGLADKYSKLKSMVLSYGGEITDTSYTETQNEKYYYVTAKLNPEKLDEFTGKLSQLGNVKSININGEDVTTVYIDVVAKLENLKATRGRLLELYNRTDAISDILEIEGELNRLQHEIDTTTQQKLYYERQSAKATITIQLIEHAPLVDKTLFNQFGQLANIFVGGLVFGLMLVAGGLGFGIPLTIILALVYVARRTFFKGKNQGEMPEKK